MRLYPFLEKKHNTLCLCPSDMTVYQDYIKRNFRLPEDSYTPRDMNCQMLWT